MQPVQALLTPSLTGMSKMFNSYDKDPTTVSLVLSPLVLQSWAEAWSCRKVPSWAEAWSCRNVPSWMEAWEQVLQEGTQLGGGLGTSPAGRCKDKSPEPPSHIQNVPTCLMV